MGIEEVLAERVASIVWDSQGRKRHKRWRESIKITEIMGRLIGSPSYPVYQPTDMIITLGWRIGEDGAQRVRNEKKRLYSHIPLFQS